MTTAPLLVDIARECWALDVPPAWRPRYEAAFRRAGAEYGIDWRLLAALS